MGLTFGPVLAKIIKKNWTRKSCEKVQSVTIKFYWCLVDDTTLVVIK